MCTLLPCSMRCRCNPALRHQITPNIDFLILECKHKVITLINNGSTCYIRWDGEVCLGTFCYVFFDRSLIGIYSTCAWAKANERSVWRPITIVHSICFILFGGLPNDVNGIIYIRIDMIS